MPVVNYTTVNGRILHEDRSGVKTLFMPDTLGNVIETRNMDTGVQTSSTTYWPYGEVRTQTGTNPSPFGFCGVWGYYTQAGQPTYVRTRYYRPNLGRWQTVDPLWPWEDAYSYVSNSPQILVDQFGVYPRVPTGDPIHEPDDIVGPGGGMNACDNSCYQEYLEDLRECARARRRCSIWVVSIPYCNARFVICLTKARRDLHLCSLCCSNNGADFGLNDWECECFGKCWEDSCDSTYKKRPELEQVRAKE